MSDIFTYVIVIFFVYQLIFIILSKMGLLKKQKKPPALPRVQKSTPYNELSQTTPQEAWKEQLKQLLENSAYSGGKPEPSAGTDRPAAQYAPADRSRGVESAFEFKEVSGKEKPAKKGTAKERTAGTEYFRNDGIRVLESQGFGREKPVLPAPSAQKFTRGGSVPFTLREQDIVQGIVWAEILGKPRARRPFRGPRT